MYNYTKYRQALFINQINSTAMGDEDDSGSSLLYYTNKAIGLLMAGSDTINDFNDINLMLKYSNIDFI